MNKPALLFQDHFKKSYVLLLLYNSNDFRAAVVLRVTLREKRLKPFSGAGVGNRKSLAGHIDRIKFLEGHIFLLRLTISETLFFR